MSKQEQKVGLGDVLKGVKDFVTSMYPGLDWEKFKQDLVHEFKQQASHGAHELGAVLGTGHGFVMYPRAGRDYDANEIEVPLTPVKEQEKEQERDQGMER